MVYSGYALSIMSSQASLGFCSYDKKLVINIRSFVLNNIFTYFSASCNLLFAIILNNFDGLASISSFSIEKIIILNHLIIQLKLTCSQIISSAFALNGYRVTHLLLLRCLIKTIALSTHHFKPFIYFVVQSCGMVTIWEHFDLSAFLRCCSCRLLL